MRKILGGLLQRNKEPLHTPKKQPRIVEIQSQPTAAPRSLAMAKPTGHQKRRRAAMRGRRDNVTRLLHARGRA